MPRKSADALAGEFWRLQKAPPAPAAPNWFSASARRYWDEIVAERPHDYFNAANRPMLECLCVTYTVLDTIWAELHTLDLADSKQFRRYRALTVMANRQGSLAAMLATKLRLLPPRGPMPQMARVRPWSA